MGAPISQAGVQFVNGGCDRKSKVVVVEAFVVVWFPCRDM